MVRRLGGLLGAWGYRVALLGLRVWWAVRRPESDGVRCVLRDGDAFVLVRHTYGDRRWMLPGGRLRRGERPPETAAREIEQELGLACTGWRQLGYMPRRRSYRRESRDEAFRRHGTYYVEATVRTRELAPRAAELEAAGWFTAQTLPAECSEALDIALANAWLV
jgi:8-oxo-dGTP pyrophosphatase MutT (NUDIX family)